MSKLCDCLQEENEGRTGKLQASQLYFDPWEGMEQIILETISKHNENK